MPGCPDIPAVPPDAIDARALGATGDGTTDDTAALQAAVDSVPDGGTLYISDGTYLVNADQHLNLKSNMTLLLSDGATLQAATSSMPSNAIVMINGASDVNIFGGGVVGDRASHIGTGEWAMGLDIENSTRVSIRGFSARECFGDGFYVGGTAGPSQTVDFCGVTADHNRRNGASIVAVLGMTVSSSTFINTVGTPPENGVDIEPNSGQVANNVAISNSLFQSNHGMGIQVTSSAGGGPHGTADHVSLVGNHVASNVAQGIQVEFSNHVIQNNLVEDSGQEGIRLYDLYGTMMNNDVSSNTVRRSGMDGISFESASSCSATGNTLDNDNPAVSFHSGASRNTVTGNTCGAGNVTIDTRGGNNNTVQNNVGCTVL